MDHKIKPSNRKLKRLLIVIIIFAAAFFSYVEIVNRNSVNMTYRQKILKAVYPVFTWFNRTTGKNNTKMSNKTTQPPVPFYNLTTPLNNGDTLDFKSLKGKKVLLVNTASDCGFTGQYEGLQSLYSRFGDKLVVIGFPANDFKEQEKGSDDEIAEFCKVNFGVRFPLAKKSVVIKNADQHPVFQWLTDKKLNGWNDTPPTWNFSKFLVNEKGILTNYFGPAIEPESKEITDLIDKIDQ